MKKLLLIALVAIALTACKRTLNPQQKLLCGKWMTSDWPHNNHEKFMFKADGTFADIEFANDIAGNSLVGDKWKIAGDKLTIRYKHPVLFFNAPYRMVYQIITLTDSVLVIERKSSQRFKAVRLAYKKMK